MRRLKVTHYLQDPSYCAVASCAVVANYCNPEIDYLYTKIVADKLVKNIGDEGLETGDSCRLLNKLGFYKITVVSSDMDVFDYAWENYGRRKMTEVLLEASKKKKCKVSKSNIKGFYNNASKLIDGVLISHPHIDHYGFSNFLHPNIQCYLGQAAHKIIE